MSLFGNIYVVPSSAYAHYYANKHKIRHIIVRLPAVAAFIAGFFDMRWWLIGIMWFMLAIPTMIMFGWFSLLTRPDMVVRMRPQRCRVFHDGTLVVHFLPFACLDEDENNDLESEIPVDFVMINKKEIESMVIGSKYIKLLLVPHSRFDILLIPTNVLTSAQKMALYD